MSEKVKSPRDEDLRSYKGSIRMMKILKRQGNKVEKSPPVKYPPRKREWPQPSIEENAKRKIYPGHEFPQASVSHVGSLFWYHIYFNKDNTLSVPPYQLMS